MREDYILDIINSSVVCLRSLKSITTYCVVPSRQIPQKSLDLLGIKEGKAYILRIGNCQSIDIGTVIFVVSAID